jgi:hypothetical protein
MRKFRLLPGVLAVGFVLQLGSAVRSSAEVIVVASDSTIQVRDGEIVIDPEGKQAVSIIDLGGQERACRRAFRLGTVCSGRPSTSVSRRTSASRSSRRLCGLARESSDPRWCRATSSAWSTWQLILRRRSRRWL